MAPFLHHQPVWKGQQKFPWNLVTPSAGPGAQGGFSKMEPLAAACNSHPTTNQPFFPQKVIWEGHGVKAVGPCPAE